MRRPMARSLAGGAAGIAAGIVGGIALTAVSAANPPAPKAPEVLDAAHVPPVLTLPGEPVRLRFAIVCPPRDDGEPCQGSGEVYVRPGQDGPFRRLSLRRGEDSKEGRYYVDLPEEIAASRDGFSYYAVLRADATGVTTTVPSGGAAAPERSLQHRGATPAVLGAHSFGHVRTADARVVEARWGAAPGDVGLAGSRELGFTGPSAFDVEPGGTVDLLDQVNGRVSRWTRGRQELVPIDVNGGLADFAVEGDGSLDVLEPPNTLRSFHSDGSPKWSQRLSDRTWTKLAHGPAGPVVQEEPSEQWMQISEQGAAVARSAQARAGRPGKPAGKGHEVIVERVGESELRVAEAVGNSPLRSWRITGETPLGEVQLAESHGNRIVVVIKTYTDGRDEFVVLVLDSKDLVQTFSIAPSEWAETAPLARFRLAGSSLYRLGSSPDGAFVDRFELEVPR